MKTILTAISLLTLALTPRAMAQGNTNPRLFFTTGLNQPVNQELELSVMNLEKDFYLCDLVIEGQIKVPGETAPTNSVLLNTSYLVLPNGYETSLLYIGFDRLMATGVPGARYAGGKIIDQVCNKQTPKLSKTGEESAYLVGQAVRLEFTLSGLPKSYWSKLEVSSQCPWLSVTEKDDGLVLTGTVPESFGGCEGKVSTAVESVAFEAPFKINRQRLHVFPLSTSLSTTTLLKKFSTCISDKEWSSAGMDFLASKPSDKGACAECHDWRGRNFISNPSGPQLFDPYRALKTLVQPVIKDRQVFFGIGSIAKQPAGHPSYSWSDAESDQLETFIETMKASFENGSCKQQEDLAKAKDMNEKGRVFYAVTNAYKSWNTKDTPYIIAPSVQQDGSIDINRPFTLYFCNFTNSPISIHSDLNRGPIRHGNNIMPSPDNLRFPNDEAAQEYLDRASPNELAQMPFCAAHRVDANRYVEGALYNHTSKDPSTWIYFKLLPVYPDGSIRTP